MFLLNTAVGTQKSYSLFGVPIASAFCRLVLVFVNTIISVFLGLNLSQRRKGEGIVFSFLTVVTNQYMLLKLQHKTLTSVPNVVIVIIIWHFIIIIVM